MRSENETPSICEETDVKVICAVEEAAEEYKDCPAACRKDNTKEEDNNSDEVVKAGNLDVTVSGESNGRVFVGRDSSLDTITLKSSEEVTISKIVLERIGYSTKNNIVSVKLEDSKGATIADAKTLDSKGQVKLTLKKDYKVVDGELDAIIVVNTYNSTAVAPNEELKPGSTVGFKVVDVESTAKDTNISGKANEYTAIAYDGSVLTFDNFKPAYTKDYNFEAGELYEVAKFRVKSPDDSSIILRGFTFGKNASTLDIRKYFDKAEVTIAGEKVSGLEANVNKDDELVISFKDVEVAAKEKAEVIVKIALVDDFDQFTAGSNTIQLSLKDFVAVDGKVESRVSTTNVSAGTPTYYSSLSSYTFKGSKIKISNTKLGNVDAALESEDIQVAEGNITVSEAIKGTFTIRATGEGAGALKGMTMIVGANDETDATMNCTIPSTITPATTDFCDFTFTNVEIEKSAKIRFTIDTKDAVAANLVYNTKTVSFNSFSADRFTAKTDVVYDESGKPAKDEISGSISFSKVTIQPAKASLSNSDTKEVEFNNKETNKKVVFNGTYTAKKGDVKLNEFIISSKATTQADLKALVNDGAGTEYNKVTFYVYVDDMEEPVADAKLVWNATTSTLEATDTFDNILVKAGESAKIKVEAEVEANDVVNPTDDSIFDKAKTYATNTYVTTTSIDLGKYDVTLKGEDTNGNAAGKGSANSVALKVVIKGSVNLSAGAAKETVLYKAADAEIAAFTVKPANGASETDLEEIIFNVVDGSAAAVLANEDDITVKVNKINVDDCSLDGTKKIVTCTMNEKVPSEGVEVTISLDEEKTGVVKITGLKVNGKTQTREFKKRFEEAVVSIKSMKDLGGTTEFTLGVEKDSDVTVSNVVLYFDNESSTSAGDQKVSLTKIFDDGDTMEAKGMKDGVRLLRGISYTVTPAAGAAYTVLITKDADSTTDWATGKLFNGVTDHAAANGDNYADFFKVGDAYARTYKAN